MEPFRKKIERFFYAFDAQQKSLSKKWREHTNRRTIIIVVCIGCAAMVLYWFAIRPPDDFPINQLITIDSGKSLPDIAATLKQQKVIRSEWMFRVSEIIFGRDRELRAGDYLFKEPKDAFSVARAIAYGAFGLEPIRIRVLEGATTKEMAVVYARNLQRFDSQKFLDTAQPLEGFLFPDTYFFLPNATEDTVISAMRQAFDQQEATIDAQIVAFGKPLKDDVVMASILEREAYTTEDRRMIAGVLWNRIQRGMALQVDAAFLYTIGRSTFQLTKKDLASDSPYNTYVHKGLPPGAIGSPSLDSLIAAVTPIKSKYLYYLADSNGVTYYSRTYEEHLAKKKLYIGN